eukprot:6576534-Ditylum_brightwellii.AAC.1
MYVNDEYILFKWDKEKLYIRIEKLNEGDLGELEDFELNSLIPDMAFDVGTARRKKKYRSLSNIPMDTWRKRFVLLDQVVEKTLENSTWFYLNVKLENRQDPRRHYKYWFPGICHPRQMETVASDTFFPSVTSRKGVTYSQFIVGLESDKWEVYSMQSESHNVSALQEYCRNIGTPLTLKTDNAQSKVEKGWSEHCQNFCIKQETTEPHSPWQNSVKPM